MKKNIFARLLCILFYAASLGLLVTIQVSGQKVTKYEPCTMLCTLAVKTSPLIAIRSFSLDNERSFLLVNPLNLRTSIQKASDVKACSTSWVELRRQYVPDPYIKALMSAETADSELQDAGITHIYSPAHGIDLTADLCPSKHGLDRNFFSDLVKIVGKVKTPLPIALAITGVWMEEHPEDFCWLVNLVESGEVDITWINHSYHHRIGKDPNLSRDFLLQAGTDIDQEILRTEKALIEHGVMPSVFFRFPGLVSSDSLVRKVVSFGLLPVGTDAWLAKNQRPTDGSIVLVHANGNEPVGIQRFFKLVQEEEPNIDNRQWQLLDLRESVVETEKESYTEPIITRPDSLKQETTTEEEADNASLE
jgi:hypothetical protein